MPEEPTLLLVVVVIQIAQFVGGAVASVYLVAKQRAVERELLISSHPAVVARTLRDHGDRLRALEGRMSSMESDVRSIRKAAHELAEAMTAPLGRIDLMVTVMVGIARKLEVPVPASLVPRPRPEAQA